MVYAPLILTPYFQKSDGKPKSGSAQKETLEILEFQITRILLELYLNFQVLLKFSYILPVTFGRVPFGFFQQIKSVKLFAVLQLSVPL